MYLSDFLDSCRRRWMILLVLLAVSAALCIFAAREIPPKYEAGASLVLIPPVRTDDPLSNRFLDLGSLSNSVDVLARSMTSADIAEQLEEVAPGAVYDVSHDLTTSAPIVLISVTSDSAASTTDMLTSAIAQVPKSLKQLQSEIGVTPQFEIKSVVLSVEPTEANNKTRVRLVFVLAAGLLFASSLAVAVIDGLLLRRSNRQPKPRLRGPVEDDLHDGVPPSVATTPTPRSDATKKARVPTP